MYVSMRGGKRVRQEVTVCMHTLTQLTQRGKSHPLTTLMHARESERVGIDAQ